MRVLIAHCAYRTRGGEDRYVERSAALLRGHHPVTCLLVDNAELDDTATTAARMLYSPARVRGLQRRLAAARPDVVHAHNLYPGFGPALHLACRRLGIPLVMTVHNYRLRCPNGLMFTAGSMCDRCVGGAYQHAVLRACFPTRRQAAAYATALWAHRFLLPLERWVHRFVAPSRFVADQLLGWGLPPERVVHVPHFVATPASATAEVGTYGLYLGRLAAGKGLETLIDALAVLGDPPFTIAGSGPLEGELRARADARGLVRTRFVGWVEEVGALLRGARTVVLPSVWHEPAPISALEAAAAGRPLVVSRVGGLTELVDAGAAIGVAPGAVDELAGALAALAADDDRCRQLGAAALALVRSTHDPDRHLDALTRVYEGAAADRAGV